MGFGSTLGEGFELLEVTVLFEDTDEEVDFIVLVLASSSSCSKMSLLGSVDIVLKLDMVDMEDIVLLLFVWVRRKC